MLREYVMVKPHNAWFQFATPYINIKRCIMKTINSLNELELPTKHKIFLEVFIDNARKINNANKIERLILFGSCARGEAINKSDIDIIALGTELDDNILGDLYYCAPEPDSGFYVENDIIIMTTELYNKNKYTYGMLQKYIEQDGVDISGLLQFS